MATIKSFTSLEQSRKLAKILPLESADMWYQYTGISIKDGSKKPIYFPMVIRDCESDEDIPCWSFTALLRFLPFHIISKNERYGFDMCKGLNKDGETYMIRYNIFNTNICLYKTEYYNSPVDACYEMILKLHELNLL